MYCFRDDSTISNNQMIPEDILNKETIEPLSVIDISADKEKHIENIFDNQLNAVTSDIYTSVAVTEENKLNVKLLFV